VCIWNAVDLWLDGGGRVLVGSAVFKTVSRALVPFWVGSIPMRLRQIPPSNVQVLID